MITSLMHNTCADSHKVIMSQPAVKFRRRERERGEKDTKKKKKKKTTTREKAVSSI